VTAEVEELLPEVDKASSEFETSIRNDLTKIVVKPNVQCRKCEYRFVANTTASELDV
jgi:hypothetical protein